MKDFIKKLLKYRKFKSCIHTGKGFIQGTGFDVSAEITSVLGFEFVTSISVDADGEWASKLKKRLNETL